MRYTRIPETAFQELQMNAGILLSDFDPDSGEAKEEDLLGATTGGISFAATPTFSDFGEDIDNCPVNVLELKRLDSWEVTASGNFITAKVGLVKLLTGAADVDPQDPRKIVPRNDLLTSDFHDLWIVGDYSDKNGDTNGGYMAIHMLNGLSTGGFQLQTTNRGKGQLAFTFTGHYSISAQDKVPFEVYVSPGKAEPSAAVQVPGQSESYLGKQISELVTEDTQVLADGTVDGTLKYVTGFTAFNESEVEEQSGNYMPVKLSMTGSKMTLKKNGTSEPEKTDIAFDPELLFRVSAKSDTFTVEVDGMEVITLSFGQAQLLTQ